MQFLDVHAKLANLGEAVVEELQERLEENSEDLSVKQLLEMGAFALDRSSAPPKSKTSAPLGALPSIKISFARGPETQQLTIEATPKDEEDFL
jgi:hypothetical protein